MNNDTEACRGTDLPGCFVDVQRGYSPQKRFAVLQGGCKTPFAVSAHICRNDSDILIGPKNVKFNDKNLYEGGKIQRSANPAEVTDLRTIITHQLSSKSLI